MALDVKDKNNKDFCHAGYMICTMMIYMVN